MKNFKIIDPLYGEIEFRDEIFSLLWFPIMQRLRHIRLSNIDSFSMPGIANISRYEHSIGVCFLASKVPFYKSLPKNESIILQATALLHDWDITPFGHLIQEGLLYVSAGYEHEKELYKLYSKTDPLEVGGLKRQLLSGREIGIDKWAVKVFGVDSEKYLEEIIERKKYGDIISNQVDLDNLDNVLRIAYHMGLDIDRSLPMKIARGMNYSNSKGVTFSPEIIDLLKLWLEVRKRVYSYLMPSRVDFSAKAMIIQATIWAYESKIIDKTNWDYTDISFIQHLLNCKTRKIEEIIQRWMTGELWHLSELYWLKGIAPDFKELLQFNELITDKLGRECFAYRIKDKRTRELLINITDGTLNKIGGSSDKWLLGVVSSKRKEFSSRENKIILEEACNLFNSIAFKELDDSNDLTQSMFA